MAAPFVWEIQQDDPMTARCFFNCKSKLVAIINELYPDTFESEANRVLWINTTQVLPKAEIYHCVSLALNYHMRKHLPLLGI